MFLFALGDNTFTNLRGFTGQVAEVVQLRSANNTVTDDLDAADAGAVVGEGTLNADAVSNVTDGEGLADAATLHFDDDTLEVLQTLFVAFDNFVSNADGVADLKLRQVGSQLFFFQLADDFRHGKFSFLFVTFVHCPRAGIGPPNVKPCKLYHLLRRIARTFLRKTGELRVYIVPSSWKRTA